MPDKTEKARRKELLPIVRKDVKGKARYSLPVPAPVLKVLFDYLDKQLESSECDDTNFCVEVPAWQLPRSNSFALTQLRKGNRPDGAS